MRISSTLVLLATAGAVNAQTPGDTLEMFFDAPGEPLELDSIYPTGCWQVGAPAKTIFTSAFSPGKALVTDTVQPYPEDTLCYAEFKLIATDWNYLGRHIYWQQQRDMDSTTQGWMEFFDPGMLQWHRYSTWFDEWYQQGANLWTDSGYVFTGTSAGWETVEAWSPCMGLFSVPGQRTWQPELRVRFAFRSAQNPNGRDGWMIDNVRAAVEICSGGVQEPTLGDVEVYPVPAADRLTVFGEGLVERTVQVELLRTDGAVARVPVLRGSSSMELDVSALPHGLYFLRLSDGHQVITQRIEVLR